MNKENLEYVRRKINNYKKKEHELKEKLNRLEELRKKPTVREYIEIENDIRCNRIISLKDEIRNIKPLTCSHDVFVWEESRKETPSPFKNRQSEFLVWDHTDIVKVTDKIYPVTENVEEVTHFSFFCLECSESVVVPLDKVEEFLLLHNVLNVNENIRYDEALAFKDKYYNLLLDGFNSEEACSYLKDSINNEIKR